MPFWRKTEKSAEKQEEKTSETEEAKAVDEGTTKTEETTAATANESNETNTATESTSETSAKDVTTTVGATSVTSQETETATATQVPEETSPKKVWSNSTSSWKNPAMSRAEIGEWRDYHKHRFFWYRWTSAIVAGVTLIIMSFALFLPSWFLAEIPQEGEYHPGRIGLFVFCQDEDKSKSPEDLLDPDLCETIDWLMDSGENESIPNGVSEKYIQFIVMRVAAIFIAIETIALVVRCTLIKRSVRLTFDVIVNCLMFAVLIALPVLFEDDPFETLRMFHFLDALEFTEADTGMGSISAQPELTLDISWHATCSGLVFSIFSTFLLHFAGQHYDQWKKMEIFGQVASNVAKGKTSDSGRIHLMNPMHDHPSGQ